MLKARPSRGVRGMLGAFWGKNKAILDRTIHALFSSFLFNDFNYLADKIVAKCRFLVARLENQIGPCSKVFKIISEI